MLSVPGPEATSPTPPRGSYVTFSLLRYGRGTRLWAFGRMGLWPRALAAVPGLRFGRLLGVGRGLAFSLRPDFGRYALLCAWADAGAAQAFLQSGLPAEARARGAQVGTYHLRALQARGSWGAAQPFEAEAAGPPAAGAPIAALTHARLRLRHLPAFWGAARASARHLEQAPGLVFSVGMGETPLTELATFSLWASAEQMKAYAYGGAPHKAAIAQKRAQGWYASELFARFELLGAEGLPVPEGFQAGSQPF